MMTQRKLTDSELAANVRARNRQASERRRERLAAGGKVQILTWIPATLRRELDSVAAARGEPLSETTAVLLSLGLKQIDATTPAATTPDLPADTTTTSQPDTTQPGYTGVVSSRDALMAEIGAMLNEGHTGADIARRLNDSGKRTANGAQFISANLLRDYRAWSKKTGNVDTTKEPT